MSNFYPISALPLTGKAAGKNSSQNRGIGLATNSKGCCSTQNPILRLLLYLVVILLALTICCSPISQVNEGPGQSCPENQLGPERPAETWEQVKIGVSGATAGPTSPTSAGAQPSHGREGIAPRTGTPPLNKRTDPPTQQRPRLTTAQLRRAVRTGGTAHHANVPSHHQRHRS